MYPIFITDDPEAEVEIKSLPGQKRCIPICATTGQPRNAYSQACR